jgi:hypothetical protein
MKSEIRNQKSEIRNQKSEIRNQKSYCENIEYGGRSIATTVSDVALQHPPYCESGIRGSPK